MEVTSLRKTAASATTPKGRGRSLTLLQLTHNTLTAAAEIAPITQYHRMVWKAVTRTAEGAEGKGPSLPMLRKLWEDAESGFKPLVAKAYVNYKFWTNGTFPHPVDVAPLPIERFHSTVTEPAIEGFDSHDFGEYVYIGGSYYPSAIMGLSKAGCAIVEVDEEGSIVRQALMPIPRHFPQTAQAAENVAYVMAMRILTRKTDLASDCWTAVQKGSEAWRQCGCDAGYLQMAISAGEGCFALGACPPQGDGGGGRDGKERHSG